MATSGEGSKIPSYGWSYAEEKAYEKGLVLYPEGCPDRWVKIAAFLPGHLKSPQQLQQRYDSSNKRAGRRQMWTEEEHAQFVLGLEKYGKGKWKKISKEFVKTRNSTQVGSHAQKHFKSLNNKSVKKQTKRVGVFALPPPTPAPAPNAWEQQQQKQEEAGIIPEEVPSSGVKESAASSAKWVIQEAEDGTIVVGPMKEKSSSAPPQSWWVEDELQALLPPCSPL